MPTFALIAEGKTDQIVLDAVISEICSGQFTDDVDVNYIQPIRDETDSHTAPHGGWELVFEYCRTRMSDALSTNDFVVVHVDTDCGDHEGFGLNLTEGGAERSYSDLVKGASQIIIDQMGEEIFESNRDRIIFAIAVHSTECCVLACLFDISREKNCFEHLQHEWGKADMGRFGKDADCYWRLARRIKRKNLRSLLKSQSSLGIFLKSLKKLPSPANAGEAAND